MAQKPLLGKRLVDYKRDEWDKGIIQIQLGTLLNFEHHGIHMKRSSDGCELEGVLDMATV